MAGTGGARPGAGRKSVADEQKSNAIFLAAIKQLKLVDTDDDARIELAKELMTFDRGKIFISEHIFGKPKETIDNNISLNEFDIRTAFGVVRKVQ
jgi:hypothetical protein